MPIAHDQIVRVLMRDRVKLLAFIQTIVRDDHMAEDILQDVSALAIHKSDQIDGEAHLLPWLRKAARYKALNLLSRRTTGPRVFSESVLDLIEADWPQHDATASSDALDALRHCLGELSPYARSVIDARYRDGLTGPKLAEAVDRKVASVYVQLSRIHHTLGDCIQRRLSTEAAGG